MEKNINQPQIKTKLSNYFLVFFVLIPPLILWFCFLLSGEYIQELVVSFYPHLILGIGAYTVLWVIVAFKYRSLFMPVLILLLIFGIFTSNYQSFYSKTSLVKNEHSLKVYYANIYWQNRELDDIISEIVTLEPDVLMLVEFTDIHYKKIGSELDSLYPYSNLIFADIDKPYAGNVIFSKFPLKDNTSVIVDGYYSGFVKSTLEGSTGEIDLYLVHTSAPITKQHFHARNRQLELLTSSIVEDRDSIILGDFNLSPWSKYYNEFSLELIDYTNITRYANKDKTWQDPRFWGIIFSHIDHVWVSKDFTLDYIEIDDLLGSDHDKVYFELSTKE